MQPSFGTNNTLYIVADHLQIDGMLLSLPGGGAFERYDPALCLTAPQQSRSVWHLPPWFIPRDGHIPLTYHSKLSRWTSTSEYTRLHSASRGQEFVLDTHHYPEALLWITNLLRNAT